MRKVYLLATMAGILGFSACKEKGPAIDFGKTPVAKDTTYEITSIPAAQKRVVVVEEFTGVSCPPCPAAREFLGNIEGQYPGQILPVEIHIFNFPQSQPKKDVSKYDFRTQDGTDIGTTFYSNIAAMPSAGINRIPINSKLLIYPSSLWPNPIQAEVNTPPVVNLTLESEYDATAKTALIKVTAVYTQRVSKKQYLTLAILEDDIVDAQLFPDSTDHNYTFKHTLRDIVTSVSGDEILKEIADKDPGRVYERTIIYQVNGEWKPENCKVVAWVHNNDADNKQILQAAEAKLKKE